jgi:hypothetical protein
MTESLTPLRTSIIARLRAEGCQEVTPETLQRHLAGCVMGRKLTEVALAMLMAGELGTEDL